MPFLVHKENDQTIINYWHYYGLQCKDQKVANTTLRVMLEICIARKETPEKESQIASEPDCSDR